MFQIQVQLKFAPNAFILNYNEKSSALENYNRSKQNAAVELIDDYGAIVFFKRDEIMSMLLLDVEQSFRANAAKHMMEQDTLQKINRELATKPRVHLP